jgi:tetratricopeptide (TPR) repeat protein
MVTDYQVELSRVDAEIARIESTAPAYPIDPERATAYAYRLYQRASLTGILEHLRSAEAAINEALERAPNGDLWLLKANLDFKTHRLAETGRDLEAFPGLRESVEGRVLTADIDFQAGRYDEAGRAYEGISQDARTWDSLARLAFFKAKTGNAAEADDLYVAAEEELTAKEMRSYAWLELQRGKLAIEYGRAGPAAAHFKLATAAYSGYWLVDQHAADLARADGRIGDAAALYVTVVDATHRPEHQQTLSELYFSLGELGTAEVLLDKALTGYLQSVSRGEVQYYHHLADFYVDARRDCAKAVEWARKDIAIRRNHSTLTVLAWALFNAGRVAEALAISDEALSTHIVDAEMLYQAAAINIAASRPVEGERLLRSATSINPMMRKNYPADLYHDLNRRLPVA